MAIDRDRARHHLRTFDFRRLFVEELGWDKYAATFPVSIAGTAFSLKGAAEKRGVVAFVCEEIPEYASRLKTEKQVAKSHFEHFIIFADRARGRQIWQWVRREPGRPLRVREHRYETSQSGELLIQKLENIQVTLEQEEVFTLSAVTLGLRAAFDIETVTKKFYERFKAEHERFLSFIEGIPDEHMEIWYASVMMNRLMFLYFIQAKAFLDGNVDYLRAKLAESKGRGSNRYYREFLCTLFFEGFARRKEERAPEVNKLLGAVPYLNGGLFQRHQIEDLYGKKIQVPDAAFDRLFDFFKEYQWHLDERPDKDDREINPDVLGYIFEKYINQKQMGAYYTKEDITEYISKNTIVPFLFDAARKHCAVAFEPDGYVWRLVRENPDRYIYEAVRRGKDRALPPEISAGLTNTEKREKWNQGTPYQDEPETFLPTETWREFIERRRRYSEIRARFIAGEVATIADFITLNADIRQFAEDVIQYSEGPELVRAFYKAISTVSVLDPTCGSGAFLFAALNVLKPLYEACLKRMDAFVEEWDAKLGKPTTEKFKDFREILTESQKHPNQDYFVLKSIIVNNLYGVDIMEEAVEICKLRLFLKLVAQVGTQERIEPLPDIDFNILAGNTLVGYARYEDVKKAVTSKFDFGGVMDKIEDKAKILDSAVEMFRQQQTQLNGTVTSEDKRLLRSRFDELADDLDDYLAGEYNRNSKKEIEEWKQQHRPLHWFSEFHRIMSGGGFDVVIGNPPYVVFPSEKVPYTFLEGMYEVASSKNLYAVTFERALALCQKTAYASLIVQLTAISSERMPDLQDLLLRRGALVTAAFPRRPESIFDGVEMPVVILHSSPLGQGISSTRVNRFYTQERPNAVLNLAFGRHSVRIDGCRLAKLGDQRQVAIYQKVFAQKKLLGSLTVGDSKHEIYYQEACRYWAKATFGLPFFKRNGERISPPHGRIICFESAASAALAACLLNSTTFWWLYSVFCDCEHINDGFVRRMPIPEDWRKTDWIRLAKDLTLSLESNASRKVINTKQGHRIEYDEIKAFHSKSLIDKVDATLAGHLGFTAEELDFITNYDIKYRMGRDALEE
jgi:hypothetical protein